MHYIIQPHGEGTLRIGVGVAKGTIQEALHFEYEKQVTCRIRNRWWAVIGNA